MPGRGGRSLGCFVCRQRHLKCDETKPRCLRCTNARLVCTGYPDSLPFINATPSSRLEQEAYPPQPRVQILDPRPGLTVLDDDVFRAYLKQELCVGNTLVNPEWIGFSALDMPDGLLRQCITSFAAALFGRRNGSDRASTEGVRLYVGSVKTLNSYLSQPSHTYTGQMALAIDILATCEALVATSNSGWIQHMVGLAAYYQLCPFNIFKELSVLRQFEGHRFFMITAAIAARRPTCLTSEEWMTLPWSFAQSPKPQRHYLLDHTSQLPSLYLKFNGYLDAANADKPGLVIPLETKFQSLLYALRSWETEWRINAMPQLKEVFLSGEESQRYGFASRFDFDDMGQDGNTYLLYNTTLIFLFELWKVFLRKQTISSMDVGDQFDIAEQRQPDRADNSNPKALDGADDRNDTAPATPPIEWQSREAALNICRTLPQYQNSSGSWVYGILMTTVVRMALVVLRQDEGSITAAWLEDVVRQLGESPQGWRTGKYMMDGHGYY